MRAFKHLFFSFLAGLSLFHAPALTAQTGEYIFIDLATGGVEYTATTAARGKAYLEALEDEAKTAILPLRRVEKGSVGGIGVAHTYYLGVFELTAAQRAALTGGSNTSVQPACNATDSPFNQTTAQQILDRLNERKASSLSGVFRFPTTNEWSFAAHGRAYTEPYTLADGGADSLLPGDAWFNQYQVPPKAVGVDYPASSLGLYNMHGNASELATAGNDLFMMGGDWWSTALDCTAESAKGWSANVTLQGRAALRVCYVPQAEQTYTLTVDGAVHGAYPAGQSVAVTAVPPTPGLTFSEWTSLPDTLSPGDDFNPAAASTTVTMPAGNLALTSSWVVSGNFLSVDVNYFSPSLTVEPLTRVAYPLPVKYKETHVLLRLFPAGATTIGSPAGEAGRSADYETLHDVTLTSDRYISVTEITRAHWARMMTPDAETVANPRLPMVTDYVSIRGTTSPAATPTAGSFMGAIQERLGALTARADLPTDAEWEIACRAGTAGSWNNGTTITPATVLRDPNLDTLGVYATNTVLQVAARLPNAAGLYDMHGNAAEWCRDQYTTSKSDPATDPLTVWGSYYVLRGGRYDSAASDCRSATRKSALSSAQAGFRLQLTLPAIRQVVVVNGSGTGAYGEGSQVAIAANPAPAGYSFSAWTVSPAGAALGADFSATSPSTTLTVPGKAVTLTATYASGLLLDVRGGTGGGYFPQGAKITIRAAQTGPDSLVFDTWVVTPAASLGAEFAPTAFETIVTMPAQGVSVTATWKDSRGTLVPVNAVKGTASATAAQPGQTVSAQANPAPFGYDFHRWEATPSTLSLNGASATGVSFTVPGNFTSASNITLTATYRLKGDYAIFGLTNNVPTLPLTFAGALPSDTNNRYLVNLVLRRIEPGTFTMGTATNALERKLAGGQTNYCRNDQAAHEVTLDQPFYIGVYEITQGQWYYLGAISTTTAASRPYSGVSYTYATGTAVPLLNTKTGLAGFSLATEEQWEYACRAGSPHAYYNAPQEVTQATADTYAKAAAWCKANAAAAQPVGAKAPNAWGLYDMLGNVDEWTLIANKTNTIAWVRGGNYTSDTLECRNASRVSYNKNTIDDTFTSGIRPVYNPPPVYSLTVNGGTGSADVILPGQTTMIAAVEAEGKRFVRWEGAPMSALSTSTAAVATVTMPAENAAYTAVFADIPLYKILVNGGYGAVILPGPGMETGITAAQAPAGQIFAGWTVSPAGAALGANFNPASPNTSVSLSAPGTVTLTATYQTKRPGARLMIR